MPKPKYLQLSHNFPNDSYIKNDYDYNTSSEVLYLVYYSYTKKLYIACLKTFLLQILGSN